MSSTLSNKQHANANSKFREDYRDIKYGVNQDMDRRLELEKSLPAWLKFYLEPAFPWPWSSAHELFISQLQVAIEQGVSQCVAMPRGEGKTTISKGSMLWAILSGKCRYGLLVGAAKTNSTNMLKDVKSWLADPTLMIHKDYKEICEPIAFLKGIPLRAKYQTCYGEASKIEWTTERIVLPATKRIDENGEFHDNPASQAILDCDGITGNIRGHTYGVEGGSIIRPDLAIVDDPQTKESAQSATQTKNRLQTINADIVGSAGPGKKMTVIVPCTVIHKDDLADQLLDRKKFPDFRGIRTSMILSWPKNRKLWEVEYQKARVQGIEDEDNGAKANKFYVEHRTDMDLGAKVGWDSRKLDTEESAIQHAMNLYLKLGEISFSSEYQNDPKEDRLVEFSLRTDDVMDSITGRERGVIPEEFKVVTSFIDVNLYGLTWCVAAFDPNMTCNIIDYGIFPKNKRLVEENASESQAKTAIYEGLGVLTRELEEKTYLRDGEPAKIDALLIDRGYQPETVHDFITRAKMSMNRFPSKGYGSMHFNPSGKNILRVAEGSYMVEARMGQFIGHNADYWREVSQRAFLAVSGSPGSASLWGTQRIVHLEFAQQRCAEKLIDKFQGKMGPIYKWAQKGKNDYGDCLNGCYVAAAWLGITTMTNKTPVIKRRRIRRRAKV